LRGVLSSVFEGGISDKEFRFTNKKLRMLMNDGEERIK